MWLFTVDGFYSAVEDQENPERIMVRARVREDLERMIGRLPVIFGQDPPEILAWTGSDYAFRIFVDRSIWACYVALAAYELDYTNFKAAAAIGSARSRAYHAVWSRLSSWQAEERFRPGVDVEDGPDQAELFGDDLW